MAKKFFYNRVYNTKRTIINLVIIGVCIIGVIICFIFTSNVNVKNHNTPESSLSIKPEVTIEVNDTFTNEIFFSKIENVDMNKIEVVYPENYDISKVGKYEIGLIINNKNYTSNLIIVDTTQPELNVKNISIKSNGSYSASDFVDTCIDNSNDDCIITFANIPDEEGNIVDYSKYKKDGTYNVQISAKDNSGNQTIKEAKLTIGTQNVNNEKLPTSCKYGNNIYDTDNYLIAIDITTNKCAVSLDLYKDKTMTAEINKLMEAESTSIRKDIDALNLSGTLALNRKVTAVINTSGDGIVGYELKMTVTLTKNNKSETVVDYKVDSNGKRVFSINPYNIEK